MTRKKFIPITILIAALLSIIILHACKKENCYTCTAYDDNGDQVTRQKICSDEEEQLFRLAYFDADQIRCN